MSHSTCLFSPLKETECKHVHTLYVSICPWSYYVLNSGFAAACCLLPDMEHVSGCIHGWTSSLSCCSMVRFTYCGALHFWLPPVLAFGCGSQVLRVAGCYVPPHRWYWLCVGVIAWDLLVLTDSEPLLVHTLKNCANVDMLMQERI